MDGDGEDRPEEIKILLIKFQIQMAKLLLVKELKDLKI